MKNCPKEFYRNCTNAGKDCKGCLAGSGSKMLYNPIDDIGDHPFKKDPAKQRRLKEAAATERSAKQSLKREISQTRFTAGSGRINGDGDIVVKTAVEDFRIEVKDRGERKSWNLTWEEFTKGVRQGISAFSIKIIGPDNRSRVIYMVEEQLFIEMLKSYRESNGSKKD